MTIDCVFHVNHVDVKLSHIGLLKVFGSLENSDPPPPDLENSDLENSHPRTQTPPPPPNLENLDLKPPSLHVIYCFVDNVDK